MTPHFFYISDIADSSSFDGKIFRKKSMLEKFRANVLNPTMQCSRGIIFRFIFKFFYDQILKTKLLLNIQFVKKLVQWVVEINIFFWEKSFLNCTFFPLVYEALEGKGLQR